MVSRREGARGVSQVCTKIRARRGLSGVSLGTRTLELIRMVAPAPLRMVAIVTEENLRGRLQPKTRNFDQRRIAERTPNSARKAWSVGGANSQTSVKSHMRTTKRSKFKEEGLKETGWKQAVKTTTTKEKELTGRRSLKRMETWTRLAPRGRTAVTHISVCPRRGVGVGKVGEGGEAGATEIASQDVTVALLELRRAFRACKPASPLGRGTQVGGAKGCACVGGGVGGPPCKGSGGGPRMLWRRDVEWQG
ncbi:hypothetical protein F5876DRAFT_70549 [Lentinula aff. lateritia]|uniref:Uncharacterized protein n=1 Tax=Lentinula aff. lateritia TaxID=2804960 RepID=A0ACC1TJ14_9AGAR|nr:hypothetical protein F5876DRAFT_70549 [Lentinula aff. lateritia]